MKINLKAIIIKFIFIFISIFGINIFEWANSFANTLVPNLPAEGVVSPDQEHFLDPKINYEYFTGRISDRDQTGMILKIKVENNNTKFFRVGDFVNFKIMNHEQEGNCQGTVRSVEDFYFSLSVMSYTKCKDTELFLKRGTILTFSSKDLSARVFEASEFRKNLILKKEGFLGQLNRINHFLHTYQEQKAKVAADYDEKLNQLLQEKQQALDSFLNRKKEQMHLQVELQRQLLQLDEALNHYQIERQEYITDRWNMDHDQGKPVGQRPLGWKNQ